MIQKRFKTAGRTAIFIITLMVVFGQRPVKAEIDIKVEISLEDVFNSKNGYDIYLSRDGDQSNTVISNVEVIGLKDIGGKMFLVIKPSGFSFSHTEGFILFDSVQAILPNKKIKSKATGTRNINFR